jgi:hypothetical protein
MRKFAFAIPLVVAAICAALVSAAPTPPVALVYVPKPVFCYQPVGPGKPVTDGLCAILPNNIGEDPLLKRSNGYRGIVDANPSTAAEDVETPFDNYSWQTFVALNWTKGKEKLPPNQGLQGDGPRVWQGWSRVSQVFGNSPVQGNCMLGADEMPFSIGSYGNKTPAPNNEEYVQAATGDPAIDVNGNWTIYERRLNGVEIAYLRAPGGNKSWDLTTANGQSAFLKAGQKVGFPPLSPIGARDAAMEIKAAWRILDPKNHAANMKKYFVVRATLAVAPDLVERDGQRPAPVCAHVDLGLVAMHIIQKNPTPIPASNLEPKWFWSTFEHVDNAPLAAHACDITAPGACIADPGLLGSKGRFPDSKCPAAILLGAPDYAYFDRRYPKLVNVAPHPAANGTFYWNPTWPYAKNYMTPVNDGGHVFTGTQISRCWAIYKITQALNVQWQAKLRAAGSVFANYMLIGTQWGANIEPRSTPGPEDAAPNLLSNSVLETFLQTSWAPKGPGYNTGSCITCHSTATFNNSNVPTDFSFLPSLVSGTTRRPPIGMPGHDTTIIGSRP